MELKLSTKPMSHEEQKIYLYLESIEKNTFKVSEIDAKKFGMVPSLSLCSDREAGEERVDNSGG